MSLRKRKRLRRFMTLQGRPQAKAAWMVYQSTGALKESGKYLLGAVVDDLTRLMVWKLREGLLAKLKRRKRRNCER